MKIKNITASTTTSIAVWYIPSLLVTGWLLFQTYDTMWWLASLAVYFLTSCFGITITFHRYLTHRSFEMPLWMEKLFTIFACLGGTGSSIGWVAVHKNHHRFADQPGDPHSPVTQGFSLFYANYDFELNKFSVRDLLNQPFHRLVHEWYNVILLAWAGILAVASWLTSMPFIFFIFFVPIFLQVTISNISNYFNHYPAKWLGSYRLFETKDLSVNNPLIAALAWGEGWHNNHHAKPYLSSFQQRWWEIDISGMIISGIKLFYKKSIQTHGTI